MLYRPNYCCHCGEKIDRARWTPLTSRRFCEFCEIEQKQHDLLPRVVLVIAILLGAAGLTSYIGRSSSGVEAIQKPVAQVREMKAGALEHDVNRPSAANGATSKTAQAPDTNSPLHNTLVNVEQRRIPQNSSTEPVYYCGALTKKGTPCTRRVRTRSRCWQHMGQPAARDTR